MSTLVPPLFAGLIEDVSLLPPSPFSLPDTLAQHSAHRSAWYAPILGPLLVPASLVKPDLTAHDLLARDELSVAVLADGALTAIAAAVRTLHAAGVAVQHLEAAVARRGEDPQPGLANLHELTKQDQDLFVYAEVPLSWGLLAALDTLARFRAAGAQLAPKFRVGGLAAELFPTPVELAAVICACRDRELPFRLAASLRHAIRHTDPETGFTHHGSLNVLMASLIAVDGAEVAEVAEALAITHPLPLVESIRARRAAPRPLFVGFGAVRISDSLTELVRLDLLNGGAQ